MSDPMIRTTVVGSYPLPDWLVALPSSQAVTDATRVVLQTQEQAGIDLVCDGELYRFDVNHPETNGMIEYFVRPMGGVRADLTFAEIQAFRAQEGMGFRTQPAGIVDGPIDGGTLDLPLACARAKSLASKPLKFTLTGPHMLAKTLGPPLRQPAEARDGHRRGAGRAGQASRRGRDPDRRGQPARPSRGVGMGRRGASTSSCPR